jgi:hypothetical protein
LKRSIKVKTKKNKVTKIDPVLIILGGDPKFSESPNPNASIAGRFGRFVLSKFGVLFADSSEAKEAASAMQAKDMSGLSSSNDCC